MKFINNMKIMPKLITAFMIVSVLGIIVGLFSIYNMKHLKEKSTELYEHAVVGEAYIAEINEHFLTARLSFRGIFMRDNQKAKLDDIQAAKVALDGIKEHLDEYEKLITTEENRITFSELKINIEKYSNLYGEMLTGVENKLDNKALMAITANYIKEGDIISKSLSNLLEYNISLAKKMSDSNEKTAKNTIIAMVVLLTFSTILSLVLGIIISLGISKPINKLAEIGKKLSIGDINVEIDYQSENEVGILSEAFRKVISATKEQADVIQKISQGDLTTSIRIRSEADIINKKLDYMLLANNNVFGEIKKAADQVNSAASQVAQGSTMLAQASTEQASTVEEINSTVGEIASQSKENANSARNANELADEARTSAETGSFQMKNMMNSMEEINEASKNISKIIRVIDDIAFQTNILALNAAVEAARAGSHGKGFAVVAEEVRNLAARSAKAANETTELIESTINKVNAGTKIASETAQALNIINEKIEKVTGMIAEIANSSGEQASSVAQVSLGMSQIAEAVQTNSATAEESAAASEELSALAMLLKESVTRFKLRDGFTYHLPQEAPEKIREENSYEQEEVNSFGKY